MEKFIKTYVKLYNNVNKMIAENITRKEILEFLDNGTSLYDWWLDKNSGYVFETSNGKYGIISKNTPTDLLEKYQTDDVVNYIDDNNL